MKALILDGVVVDVQESEFEVHSSFAWVDCGDDVKIGWKYSDGSFVSNTAETTDNDDWWRARLRNIRNKLLLKSDWTQTADCSLSDEKKAEWAVYRNALRDLPQNFVDERDEGFSFPAKPE